MDIKSIIAGAFAVSDKPAGTVAPGTFSGMLAAAFGMSAEEMHAEEKAEDAKRKRTNRADPETRQRETNAKRAYRAKKKGAVKIAVIDFETDPFDPKTKAPVYPFVAELYAPEIGSVVIWEENLDAFIDAVISAIENLPDEYIVYAHNGGKFDYMFLMHKLRGKVTFKGRGLMSAKIGRHEIRDSFHIIPEKLAAYRKEEFDYSKNTKAKRAKHKAEILEYLHSDCVYLHDIVAEFNKRYGNKVSIGQAAASLLRAEYKDIQFIHENTDAKLRKYFFGGRVECIAGAGEFLDKYKLYDVNSMYPDVMANKRHPIGCDYEVWHKEPDENTAFVSLRCFSDMAFPTRSENGSTIFPAAYGEYNVTIHEYTTAKQLGIISDVEILACVDNNRFTDFSRFILPLYSGRQNVKAELKKLRDAGIQDTPEWIALKKDDIFLKLLMNNAYGKFAQNPRRFVEWYFTDPGECPAEDGYDLDTQMELFDIWKKPQTDFRFNNVGTAASITGAARSVLMYARHHAVKPIYCDTDSLICLDLPNVEIHPTKLGAWDIEAEMSHVVIAGKKLYGYTGANFKKPVTKCKGGQIAWEELRSIAAGATVISEARAPTLTRYGEQNYINRRLRATTEKQNHGSIPEGSHGQLSNYRG